MTIFEKITQSEESLARIIYFAKTMSCKNFKCCVYDPNNCDTEDCKQGIWDWLFEIVEDDQPPCPYGGSPDICAVQTGKNCGDCRAEWNSKREGRDGE